MVKEQRTIWQKNGGQKHEEQRIKDCWISFFCQLLFQALETGRVVFPSLGKGTRPAVAPTAEQI
jgi:hypothetical protein